jgi:hypothetical protein
LLFEQEVKSEARNPKQIQKGGNAARNNQEPSLRPLPVLNLQHLDFLNCFGFRISRFGFGCGSAALCLSWLIQTGGAPGGRACHNSVCSVCSVV